MCKIYCLLFFVLLLPFCGSPTYAAEADSFFRELPEVAQGSDVHNLASTYCKVLWSKVQAGGCLNTAAAEFKDVFAGSVSELGRVIENIKNESPIMVGAQLNLSDKPVVDPDVLAFGSYFDNAAYPALKLALTSMGALGKHKGGADLDIETNARVSEVFVYVWGKVKEDPESRLQSFLIGLIDAAPTCIQGYTVRMLCAVHPPKLKGVVKK
jgi:hypothetical protein